MRTAVKSNALGFVVLLLSLALSVSVSYAATDIAVDWFTIDGSSGVSAGMGYSIIGTAGQPDVAVLSGGQYTLEGGFWSLVAHPPTSTMPLLSMSMTPTNTIVISWPYPSDGFILQQNQNLATANWTALLATRLRVDDQWQVNISTSSGTWFYRLYRPSK